MKSEIIIIIRLICLIGVGIFGTFFVSSAQQKNILKALERHEEAVYVLQENITNPFIELGKDGYYYLTGTVPSDLSLNKTPFIKVWRSKDLAEWESLSEIKLIQESIFVNELQDFALKRNVVPEIWSPEAHNIGNRWVIVHTSNVQVANLMLSNSSDIKSIYTEPLGLKVGFQVDPTIFIDDDGTPWLLSNCTQIRKIKKDFSDFDGGHKLISPINRQLGFEGTRMIKIANKYVLFGTSWSTDIYGKGTYNLYYTTSDRILGPYRPRKFAGRFLGNGAPFKDKKGRWWALAFKHSDQILLSTDKAENMDLSNSAYTINKIGLTLVPLDIKLSNGEVVVISKDYNYRSPGKEEVQQF